MDCILPMAALILLVLLLITARENYTMIYSKNGVEMWSINDGPKLTTRVKSLEECRETLDNTKSKFKSAVFKLAPSRQPKNSPKKHDCSLSKTPATGLANGESVKKRGYTILSRVSGKVLPINVVKGITPLLDPSDEVAQEILDVGPDKFHVCEKACKKINDCAGAYYIDGQCVLLGGKFKNKNIENGLLYIKKSK